MKRLAPWLLLAGFVLTIFGSKLALIAFGGSDLPFMDQWDAEAEQTFRPWLEHRLEAADLLLPHNEHRLITTRLYTLALLRANGQWSARLEMVANAAIHTAAAVVLLLFARRWLRGGTLAAFGLLMLAAFSLPFSWENSLCGFQVQFYFLLLFSLGHLSLVLRSDRFDAGWWLGQICGLLAVVSMASGFLSAAAVTAVLAWRLTRERRLPWAASITLACSVALVALGWFTRVSFPGHEPLHAQTASRFFHSLACLLAWPGPLILPLGLVPGALALWLGLRRRSTFPFDGLLLGLALWSVLQCVALAYARGSSDMILSSRYLDLLTVHLAVGFVLLCLVLDGAARVVGAGAWLIAVLAALAVTSHDHFQGAVVPNIGWHEEQENNVRTFLRTGDSVEFHRKNWPDLPYVDASLLEQRITDPHLRAILPPVVQPGLPIAAASSSAPLILPADLQPPPQHLVLSTYAAPGSGPFVWRSAPQPPSALPLLRFRVAGDLGSPGRALRLVVKSAAGEVPLEPDGAPGLRWKTVTLVPPPGEWWLEASDADSLGWFAVAAPVEVGPLTWLTEKFLKYQSFVLGTGVLLLVLGCAVALRCAVTLAQLRQLPSMLSPAFRAVSAPPLRRPWSEDPRVIWGAFFAAIVLLIAHKPWALTEAQFWAEDSTVHLMGNELYGAAAFLTPYRGYLHTLPRLIAWFASQVADVAWWPLIYNSCALLVAVGIFARYASRRMNLPGKPWIILSFVLAAHTGEVFLNITNLHWMTAFLLMAQVLIDRPTTWGQRALDLSILCVIGLTGTFIIVFMPLIAWRWWRDRHHDNLAVLMVASLCAATQLYFFATTGERYGPQFQPLNLPMLLTVAGSRLAVWPLFGQYAALHLPYSLLAGIGLTFIALLLLWALRPHPRRLLRLQAMAAFGLFAALCMYRVRPDTWAQPDLENGDSYFYIPRTLLAWLLIWEIDGGPRLINRIARAFCLLAVALELPHHHEPARPNYHWAEHCDPMRHGQPVDIPTLPEGWIFRYPGRSPPP